MKKSKKNPTPETSTSCTELPSPAPERQMTYSEKLKDPRWQKKRLEIMQRDNFTCRSCGDKESTLNVHHFKYAKDIWGGDDDDKITLCEACHESAEMGKKMMAELNKEVGVQTMWEIVNALHMAHLTLRAIGGQLSGDAIITKASKYMLLCEIRKVRQDTFDVCDVAMNFGDFVLEEKYRKKNA